MKKGWILVVAVGIGAVNAVVFLGFEAVVKHGRDWIWNDVFGTDTRRWLVVPVAILLSVLFSALLRLLREPRWIEPETNLNLNSHESQKPTLKTISSGLAVGASGLLAGASLGPEMPLTENSQRMGSWISNKIKVSANTAALLITASIGALMVAFFGSMILVILPFLLVFQKAKKISADAASLILLAAVSAYATLWLFNHHPGGYFSIPAGDALVLNDYWGAFVIGLCVSIFALLLIRIIKPLGSLAQQVQQTLPWYIAATVFGLVLGGLFLIGGQSVESNGGPILVSEATGYGAAGFLGLAIVKLLATAWSKASGYRGGLFVPSIFMGVSLSLCIGSIFPSLAGPGILLGAIAAIFTALLIPDKPFVARQEYAVAAIITFLFMAALLPLTLLPLVLFAVIGAAIGNKLLLTIFPAK